MRFARTLRLIRAPILLPTFPLLLYLTVMWRWECCNPLPWVGWSWTMPSQSKYLQCCDWLYTVLFHSSPRCDPSKPCIWNNRSQSHQGQVHPAHPAHPAHLHSAVPIVKHPCCIGRPESDLDMKMFDNDRFWRRKWQRGRLRETFRIFGFHCLIWYFNRLWWLTTSFAQVQAIPTVKL